ncbi:WD40/YVTN/BNR-like repeat-containing protein [Inhella sp.]|uniref:WD40/YVTN/BNR-like repeat-containing protein n=1 Tax=Inhella sp. TaxID=1921806 RepID=UPI0035B20938
MFRPVCLTLLLALCGTSLQAARPRPAEASTPAARDAAWQQHQRMERESPARGLRWRSIGPTVQGGRVVDVEMVPGQPASFYVAYASGGVWKTVNHGGSFEPLTDQLFNTVVGDIAVDPQAPDTLWVGMGEPNAARSNYGGNGVYLSRDGGRSFEHKGLADSDRIARVLVDPRNSRRVFVAAAGKLYSPGGSRGVFLTEDGGASWRQVLKGENDWTGASDLIMDPRDPDTLYAALWDRKRTPWQFTESGPGSALYKSHDGGRSWTKLASFPAGQGVGRIGLSISPARPDTVYASVDLWRELPAELRHAGDRPLSPKRLKAMSKEEFLRQDPDELEAFVRAADLPADVDGARLLAGVKEGSITLDQLRSRLLDANAALFDADIWGLTIWRSDDAGTQWRRTHERPLRNVTYTYGYFFGQVRVDPQDAERVYALGVPLIVSSDGGKSWSGYANHRDVHVDHHALWIDPQDPKRILLGNDGGLDISYDRGVTWRKLDAQPVGQFYTIHADMAEPYNVYGGLQDNGTMRGSSRTRWEYGQDWTTLSGGDGAFVAVDGEGRHTYTGYQFGNYMRHDADGKRSEVRPRSSIGEAPLRYNWMTPVMVSPHNPQVLYFAANRLFRSFDKAKSFQPISPDLSRTRERGNVPFGTITTLSESTRRFGQVAVGTDDGQLHVSRDGGLSWQDVGDGLPQDRWVSRVEWSHHVEGRLYASLNGYRQDDDRAYLYVSEDFGRNWRPIASGLPAEPINVVREDTVTPELLYVGTDRGVYASMDRGASWMALDGGLPNVPVHDLFVHVRDRELIAGTHGRSAWVLDLLPLQERVRGPRSALLQLFHLDAVQADRNWRREPDPWFDRSEYLPSLRGTLWSAAGGRVQLSLVDGNGKALARFEREAVPGLNSFEWDLRLEPELVLAAEQEALQKLPEADRDQLRHRRYSESVRLGHRLYPLPGKYRLRAEAQGASAETPLEIKAPRAFEPRLSPPLKRRGEGMETVRTQTEPLPHPRAGSRGRALTLPGR